MTSLLYVCFLHLHEALSSVTFIFFIFGSFCYHFSIILFLRASCMSTVSSLFPSNAFMLIPSQIHSFLQLLLSECVFVCLGMVYPHAYIQPNEPI